MRSLFSTSPQSVRVSRLSEGLSGTKSNKELAAFQGIWGILSQIRSFRSQSRGEEEIHPDWGICSKSLRFYPPNNNSPTLNKDHSKRHQVRGSWPGVPLTGHYCQESHGSQRLKTLVKQIHDTGFINLPELKSKGHSSYKRHQRSIFQICHFSKTSHTNPMAGTWAQVHTDAQRKESSLPPLWVTGLWSQINTWKQLTGPQGESGDSTVWFALARVWCDGRE